MGLYASLRMTIYLTFTWCPSLVATYGLICLPEKDDISYLHVVSFVSSDLWAYMPPLAKDDISYLHVVSFVSSDLWAYMPP